MHYSHLSAGARAEYFRLNPAAAARTENILTGSDGLCLVAETGGEIISYLIGSLETNPLTPIVYAALENLYVQPMSRRQGVGSEIFEQFRSWAESAGATRFKVDVSPKNTAAIKFYEHLLFAPATLTLERRL